MFFALVLSSEHGRAYSDLGRHRGGEEKTAEGGSGGWMWVAGDHLLFSSLLFQTCSLATVVRVSAYSGRFERRPWSGGRGLPLASTVWVFRPGFRKFRPPQSDPQTSIDPASNSELATRGRVALKGRVALIAPIAGRRAVPTKWWHGCLCTGIGAAQGPGPVNFRPKLRCLRGPRQGAPKQTPVGTRLHPQPPPDLISHPARLESGTRSA